MFRLLYLRRLVAACLTVCLGFFSAESLTAEVHDGDATHAELVRADGAREHGAAHRAALVADAAREGRPTEGQPALRTAPRTTGGETIPAARGMGDLGHHASAGTASVAGHTHGGPAHGDGVPEHAGHVCHCGHAHLAPLPLVTTAPRAVVGVRAPVPAEERAVLLSRADEPAVRPPIG